NTSSSRRLTLLNLDLPLTLYFPNGLLYVKPGVTHGLRALGAFDDRASPYTPKAQYKAGKLYVFSNWHFGPLALAASFDGQYSREALFSTEAFYIGGEYSVRGFKDEGEQGDSGFVVRNDLTLSLDRLMNSEHALARALKPGVFVDYGQVTPRELEQGAETRKLAGAGGKISFNHGMFEAAASYARVIRKREWMEEKAAFYLYAGLKGDF
ncbi:MAG: ShlB/FhaC/HecB family hemolysin secretion/activation protein, partial [Deltaproteobacteria bacterium]|nr:ShlB/FhaC/HecB family hemolysin secretion/activation protein [Deltaproteobacteria bacterium]